MNESFKQNETPAWSDISLQEIEALLEGEQFKKAVTFARLRLDGVRGMPKEIDRAKEDPLSKVPREDWEAEQEGYIHEIAILEEIIQKYDN